MDVSFLHARSDEELAAARRLFEEYATHIPHDLCFQHFDRELADLRAAYPWPRGTILLAARAGQWAGCVAVRPQDDDGCEMKRLFVRPGERRTGLGRRLAEEIMTYAGGQGYRRMFLDTLASMTAARNLYASLGFRETAPYYHNPLPDVVYYEVELIQRP